MHSNDPFNRDNLGQAEDPRMAHDVAVSYFQGKLYDRPFTSIDVRVA